MPQPSIPPLGVPASVRNAPFLQPLPPVPPRSTPSSDVIEVEVDGAVVEFPASMSAAAIDQEIRRMRGSALPAAASATPSLLQRVVPTAMRVVPTVAGGVLGSVLGPPGMAAGGALGAGLGEYGAELFEQDTGQRQAINPTQIAVQAGLGAIPLGRVPGAGATAEQLLTYAATLPQRRALQGAALGAGSAVATNLAETGELPAASQLVVPGVFGAVTGGIGGRFERAPMLSRAEQVAAEAAAAETARRPIAALPPGPAYVVAPDGRVAPAGTDIPVAQAPDPSFVRGVQAEYARRDVRGALPPAPRFSAPEAGPALPFGERAEDFTSQVFRTKDAAMRVAAAQNAPNGTVIQPVAGGRGWRIVLPAPPDPSFVRGVPAEYARRESRGALPPATGYLAPDAGPAIPVGDAEPIIPGRSQPPSMLDGPPVTPGESSVRSIPAAPMAYEREGRRLVPTQFSSDPNATPAPHVDLTPDLAHALRWIREDMANIPFVKHTFNEIPRGRGGDLDIVPGSAGAAIYGAIVGDVSRASRSDVIKAIDNLLAGKRTPVGDLVLGVAQSLAKGNRRLRRLMTLPPSAGDLPTALPPETPIGSGRSAKLAEADAAGEDLDRLLTAVHGEDWERTPINPQGHGTLPAESPAPGLRVQRMATLPAVQASVQERAASAVEANPDAFINLYRERFGNVVNADNAKELFPEYSASNAARTANDLAVHRPASAIAQAVYRDMLTEPAPVGKTDLVLFTAGGTGAGKTTGLKEILPDLEDVAQITYDSTLSDLPGAIRDIDAALAAGKQVGVVFTDRDPLDAFRGTLARGMSGGRPVTLNTHVRSHLRSGDAFESLRQRYRGEPVEFIVVASGPSGRSVATERTPWGYDESRLYGAASEILETERTAGRVSEDFYQAVRGGGTAAAPPPEGLAGASGARRSRPVPPPPERSLTSDSSESGQIQTGLVTRLGAGAAGAAYGAATGEDPEDRIERAALFGAAGAALPSIFSRPATRPDTIPTTAGSRVRGTPGQPAIRFTDRSPVPRAGDILRKRLLEFPSLQKQPAGVRDEIAAILEQHGGFTAQRRGVQSWERTHALAERIAVPLKTLRPGTTLNAEELAAYRDALASVMTERQTIAEAIRTGKATDVDKLRFAKLTDEGVVLVANFRGAKAEAGRSLNILRAKARALEFGDSALIEQAIKAPNFDGDLKRVADAIAEAGDDPVKQLDALKALAGGTLYQRLQAGYYNSLLSGVKTHLRNVIGNSANAVANLVTPIGAAPLDAARSALTGTPREVYLRELPEGVVATFTALPQALRDFSFTLKHGYTPATVSAAAAGVFDTPRVEVPGGTLTNWPSRLLEASDSLFRSLARNQELHMGAYAAARRTGRPGGDLQRMTELIAGTGAESEALRRRADAFARRAVFQEDPGAAITYLLQIKSNPAVHPAIRTAATFIAPFMRTPSNILRQGLEASPIGFTMPAAKQRGREGAQAMGRAAIGSVALMPLAYMAATGRLSGNGPTDPGERAALLEKGWQANSIKVGDRWIRFQLFQPLSVPAAAVANAFERFLEGDRSDRAAEEAVGQAVAGAAASLLDQSFLAGLNGVLDAISDPDRNAQQFLSVFAQGLMPGSGLLRNVTQAVDPVVRRPEGVREAVKTIIPGLTETVPAKQSRFGEDVQRQGGPIRRGFLVPEVSAEKADVVADTLSSLGIAPQIPRARLQRRGQAIPLTREQEQVIVKAIGRVRRLRLEPVIQSRGFQQLSEEARRRMLENILASATRDVNGMATGRIVNGAPITVEQLVGGLTGR